MKAKDIVKQHGLDSTAYGLAQAVRIQVHVEPHGRVEVQDGQDTSEIVSAFKAYAVDEAEPHRSDGRPQLPLAEAAGFGEYAASPPDSTLTDTPHQSTPRTPAYARVSRAALTICYVLRPLSNGRRSDQTLTGRDSTCP